MLLNLLAKAKKRIIRTRSSQPQNLDEEIAKLAYQFFIERGCQHGHAEEDWARAEKIVKSRPH